MMRLSQFIVTFMAGASLTAAIASGLPWLLWIVCLYTVFAWFYPEIWQYFAELGTKTADWIIEKRDS